jgi:hypothetical protein
VEVEGDCERWLGGLEGLTCGTCEGLRIGGPKAHVHSEVKASKARGPASRMEDGREGRETCCMVVWSHQRGVCSEGSMACLAARPCSISPSRFSFIHAGVLSHSDWQSSSRARSHLLD